jgi:hypothetical protein
MSINLMHFLCSFYKSMSRGQMSGKAILTNFKLFPEPEFILQSLEINKINIGVPKNKFESN